MNFIVFGASGRTGMQFVRQALDHGHHVTAFVRERSKFAHLHEKDLTVILGELSDLDALRMAIAGKDVVISTLGVSKTLRHDAVVIDGIANIAKAMELENVHRFIYLSVFLAFARPRQFSFFATNILKRILSKEVEDHEVKETIIRERVKEYTIVRATRLTDKPLTAAYEHGEQLTIRNFLPNIPRADVAHFMLQQATSLAYRNKAVMVSARQKT